MAFLRATKKQTELLTYMKTFIAEHGYSPSYREIMEGLGYTSVATVAAHIRGLQERGYLRTRYNAARSVEIVPTRDEGEEWLIKEVGYQFTKAEHGDMPTDSLQPLVDTLRILGLSEAQKRFEKLLQGLEQQEPEARTRT